MPAPGSGRLAARGQGTIAPGAGDVRPADAAAVQDVVREAGATGTPVRLVGRGTWLDAGRPVVDAQPLRLDALTGIVDYTPGDLTLTARAGTTLAEIAAVTAREGQWLALAAWGGDDGSLGATVATASAGPTSGALGTPRDIVIGLEAVTGTGDIVRGGGRVVKNVAGFDLTRLMVGAWGTLGVLTEVSVRLRALPEREATVAMAVPNAMPLVADLLARLRGAPVAPLALEIVSAPLARLLDLGTESVLLARIAGNAELVAAQHDAFADLGPVTNVTDDVWTRLRAIEPAGATVLRLSSPVATFAATWTAAERLAATTAGGVTHASVLRSIARVILPDTGGSLAAPALAAIRSGSTPGRIFERLPAGMWSVLAPSAVGDRLSRGVRAAFDPKRLLNPGILGEESA